MLDMGTPIKIDTMARNLIRLSGLRPDIDIKIEYSGLRPGEKLFEERLMSEEGLETTPNKLISIGKPLDFDEDNFLRQLKSLSVYMGENSGNIRDYIKRVVTTYHTAQVDSINSELFDNKKETTNVLHHEDLPQAAN